MVVEQAGVKGSRLLRSPEARSENTRDDVSCVTVTMLSLYTSVGARGTREPRFYLDIRLSRNYIAKIFRSRP